MGRDRFDARFLMFGGWQNTDSILGEARTTAAWYRVVDDAQPGDLIVFPSVDLDHDGSRDRIGHVGLISHVPFGWAGDVANLKVIHCSASGRVAVRESSGSVWAHRGVFRGRRNPRWAAAIVRVVPR